MNLFGIWDVGLNRLTYNRQYGVTNTGIQRHAARFNLWKKSYQDDGKTPIPYNQRELRTIPYYAESSLEPFPPELFDSGKRGHPPVERRGQVRGGRRHGLQTSGRRSATRRRSSRTSSCGATTRCRSASTADALQGGPEAAARRQGQRGARRRRQSDLARAPGRSAPLVDLLGQPAAERRSARLRPAAVRHGDRRDHLGPGVHLRRGARHLRGALARPRRADPRQAVARGLRRRHQHQGLGRRRTGRRVEHKPTTLDARQVRSMYKSMDFTWARGQAPEAPIDTSSPTAFINSWKNREDAMYKANLCGQSQADLAQVRRDKLRGAQLEAMMITPDIMAMGGAAPATDWTSLSEAEKIRVSPLRSQAVRQAINDAHGHDARLRRRLRRLRRRGRRAARARSSRPIRRSRTLDPEAIRQQLRKDIFLGGDAARGRPQHGPAPQLPRLVGRDELLPGLLGSARGGGGEPGGEEVRRHRPVVADADRRRLHRHRRATTADAQGHDASALRRLPGRRDLGRRGHRQRPRVPVLVDHGLRRGVQLGPHRPRSLRQGGDEVQLRR